MILHHFMLLSMLVNALVRSPKHGQMHCLQADGNIGTVFDKRAESRGGGLAAFVKDRTLPRPYVTAWKGEEYVYGADGCSLQINTNGIVFPALHISIGAHINDGERNTQNLI